MIESNRRPIAARGTTGPSPAGSRLRPGDRGLVLLAGLSALFLGLPILTLVGRAVTSGALAQVVGASTVVTALGLSLATTAISLLLTVGLGLPLAFVLARRRFRGVVGGALAASGLDIAFTTAAVVVAQTFVSAPFFVRSARAGIAGVDRDLEDVARVDGASELHLFRAITVPLAAPALAAGLVMTWARALGEFGATIMFAGNFIGRTQTLPLVVYSEFQGGDLDASVAAAAILVVAALGILVAVRAFHWGRALDVRGLGVSP